MSKETGGLAFPIVADKLSYIANSGMTLRDYFAAKAIQPILAIDGTYNFEQRAKTAYEMADAMLKAREE